MANPPRKKGTKGEVELKKELGNLGVEVQRTSAGKAFDLVHTGDPGEEPLEILATRPDNGQWLLTMNLEDFAWMVNYLSPGIPLHIEVKRYSRFSMHTIWEKKFGRG